MSGALETKCSLISKYGRRKLEPLEPRVYTLRSLEEGPMPENFDPNDHRFVMIKNEDPETGIVTWERRKLVQMHDKKLRFAKKCTFGLPREMLERKIGWARYRKIQRDPKTGKIAPPTSYTPEPQTEPRVLFQGGFTYLPPIRNSSPSPQKAKSDNCITKCGTCHLCLPLSATLDEFEKKEQARHEKLERESQLQALLNRR